MEYTLSEARAEIDSLRAKLADSVSRETLIATEQERDEARKEITEAKAFVFNLTPNRTVDDHQDSLDKQLSLLDMRLKDAYRKMGTDDDSDLLEYHNRKEEL